MRHAKRTCKLNRNTSHRRCMFANMLKSLIENESITTTLPKAKELRRHADRLITLAKKNTLASRRQAIAKLMLRFNQLSPKESREAKKGNTAAYNTDRKLLSKLFDEIGAKYSERSGGYTRIYKGRTRVGDGVLTCLIELV